MSFTESLSTCFKKTFVLKGRASRSEFWWFQLLFSVCYYTLIIINETGSAVSGIEALFWICIGIVIVCLIPQFTVTIRRLHDIDKSGFFILIALIPFIGSLILLFILITEGTKGKNRFGKNPLKKR